MGEYLFNMWKGLVIIFNIEEKKKERWIEGEKEGEWGEWGKVGVG